MMPFYLILFGLYIGIPFEMEINHHLLFIQNWAMIARGLWKTVKVEFDSDLKSPGEDLVASGVVLLFLHRLF